MKKLVFIFAWLLLLLPLAGFGQGAAFDCDGTFYQIKYSGNSSRLYKVDRTTSPFTTTEVMNLNATLNCLIYNPNDSYLYALDYVTAGGQSVKMYKIGQGGAVAIGTTNLPGIQFAGGAIDKDGRYIVSPQGVTLAENPIPNNNRYNDKLYYFDLTKTGSNRLQATTLTLNGAFPTTENGTALGQAFDLAIRPNDQRLYGVQYYGALYEYTIDYAKNQFGFSFKSPTKSINARNPLGTSFFDIAGNLYAYSNAGAYYKVNLNTGVYTYVNAIDAAAISDGASCVSPQGIDVLKTVGNVTAIDNRTFEVPYTIRIKNTGNVVDNKVQINDFLTGTDAATNEGTTFPAASSITISKLTLTNGTGAGLVLNKSFTGLNSAANANTNLLDGLKALSPGQEATITFTARVQFASAAEVPTAVQNNTAYASSVSTSATIANGGYQLIEGEPITPGNLVASDLSNNSNTFPTVSGDDDEVPTPVTFPASISGVVFEDVNYGGGVGRALAGAPGAAVRSGAVVELYNSTGTFMSATTTAADGSYQFLGLTNGANYTVRVVNSTVTSSRNTNNVGGLIGVQTFVNGDVNRVGGEAPEATDAPANPGGSSVRTLAQLSSGTVGTTARVTPQSLASVRPTGSLTSVDFGFNFDVITTTRDAGQGSLRQFILNANALPNDKLAQVGQEAGKEVSLFMIPNGKAAPGLRSGLVSGFDADGKTATIRILSTLPDIGDANTTLDGSRQTAITGDTNPTSTALNNESFGPEVIINYNGNPGLYVTGPNTSILNLGLTGTGDRGISLTNKATGALIRGNTIFGNGANITLYSATNAVIDNNLIRNSTRATADGIELNDGSNGNSITNNQILRNAAFGIDFITGANIDNTITGNTFVGNGVLNGDQKAGIGIRGAGSNNNLILRNTFTDNVGAGIVALAGTHNNTFSQNSFANNGGLGIDLAANTTASGDGVTLNANSKLTTSGANSLLNYPVIAQAKLNNNALLITGFATPGATIEFYIAAADPTGFGEGKTFLVSRVEGSADDLDSSKGSYSGNVNGLAQGAETNQNRFSFSIPANAFGTANWTALSVNGIKLTALATKDGVGSSEFSGVITLGSGPLPVELTSFAVTASGADALLSWSTASEKNNAYFQVERSLDGTRFGPLTQVSGQGTTTSAQRYSYRDANAAQLGALLYYRLRQVDRDGTESFSPVRSVRLEAPQSAVTLYPNPTAGLTSLDLRPLQAGAAYTITLLDMAGRVMKTQTLTGGLTQTLDLTTLTNGSYLVVIQGNGLRLTQHLTKQ